MNDRFTSVAVLAVALLTCSQPVSALPLGLTQPGTISNAIGFRPGQQVQLYGDLSATTGAFAGGGPQTGYVSSSYAVADAANSANFHIDVLTPGGSYSTLSGASYLNPVPEPSTWILFASGLLVVGRLAHRRAVR